MADAAIVGRRWDRKSVGAALRAQRARRLPMHYAAVRRRSPDLHAAAIRHFATYDDALRALRIDPAAFRARPVWSRREIVRQLIAFERAHGGLRSGQVRTEASALYAAVTRHFHGMTAARRAVRRAGGSGRP
ncbi:MAG: hypothetical protein ACAI43_03245 [Phycisphaerae bacterium]